MGLSDKHVWNKFEEFLINEGLTQKRIEKHKYLHSLFRHLIQKPIMDVTEQDLKRMVVALSKNELVGLSGKPLGGWTKSDVKKHIKKLYRILYTNGEYDPPLTRWLKTVIPKDEKAEQKEIITKEEALKLAGEFKKPQFKLLILIAFDSGFRIEELLSMKRADLEWKSTQGAESCFWVRCRASKTITRCIDIGLFTEQIKELLDTPHYTEQKTHDDLFQLSYDSFRQHLKRRGQKLLGKVITPHTFRHSSATLYASLLEGNLIALCDRYGWTYDSTQPRIYIRRSGINNKFSARKVYQNNLSELEEKLKAQEKLNQKLQEQMRKIEKAISVSGLRK